MTSETTGKVSSIRAAGPGTAQQLPTPLSVDQLLSLPPLRWRVSGLIPEEGLGVLYGPPGVGKTFVALDLAFSIALGGEFAGLKTQRGAVIYVVCEGARGFRDRVDAYTVTRGCFNAPVGFQIYPINLFTSGSRALIECARSWQETVKPRLGLIVIDTLARASAGMDENSGRDMGQVIQAADTIWRELGCFVLLVHHSGKDISRGSRGHNSLLGALDFEGEVSEGRFTARKVKDSEVPAPISFQLAKTLLPNGRDTCLVQWAGGQALQPDKAPQPQGDIQKLVMTLMTELCKTVGELAGGGAPTDRYAVRKVVLHDRFRAEQGNRSALSYLNRALSPMLERGVLCGNADWLWLP